MHLHLIGSGDIVRPIGYWRMVLAMFLFDDEVGQAFVGAASAAEGLLVQHR